MGLNDQNLGTKNLPPPPKIVALGPRDDKNTIHKGFKTIFDSAQSTKSKCGLRRVKNRLENLMNGVFVISGTNSNDLEG